MNINYRGGGDESVQLGTSVVSLATWIFNTAAQTLRRILDAPDSKVSLFVRVFLLTFTSLSDLDGVVVYANARFTLYGMLHD